MKPQNPMKNIRIEKVTVNMGVGQTGEELEKAITILKEITNANPVKTKCKVKAPTWGIREGLTIGTKTTLRKQKAQQFLKNALQAKENKLKEKNFDKNGNFGFGIKEYVDLPKVKYNPDLGIKGLDVLVTLERKGYRIKKRKINKQKIPKRHKITKQEAINYMKEQHGVEIA
jgi:large subunit ribosomal protein L5